MTQILTDDEYAQVISMAVQGAPQTEHQLIAIIKKAEEMRTDALLLECVLSGKMCMYDEKGQVMFWSPKTKP